MPKFELEIKPGKVILKGVIDETVTLVGTFESFTDVVEIDLGAITMINSTGVREWVSAIYKCKAKKIYTNCPVWVIDQANMVKEFLGNNSVVESFFGRYYCEDCDEESQILWHTVKDFPDLNNIEIPEKVCNCGQLMQFDDDEDEYFTFLMDI